MKFRAIALAVALGACDEPQAVTVSAVERGRELFESPEFGGSQFNVFACATCHPTTPTPAEETVKIALSLHDTTRREAWWDGGMTRLYDAVDFCYRYFMRGFPSLDPTSDEGRALFEYLASLGAASGPALPPIDWTIVETIVDLPSGDAARGKGVYDASCAPCHGAPSTGEGRLGPLVSIVPDASREVADELDADPRLIVIEKVRHGQFFGVGGNMPFYPREILDDDALADLLEYLDP